MLPEVSTEGQLRKEPKSLQRTPACQKKKSTTKSHRMRLISKNGKSSKDPHATNLQQLTTILLVEVSTEGHFQKKIIVVILKNSRVKSQGKEVITTTHFPKRHLQSIAGRSAHVSVGTRKALHFMCGIHKPLSAGFAQRAENEYIFLFFSYRLLFFIFSFSLQEFFGIFFFCLRWFLNISWLYKPRAA